MFIYFIIIAIVIILIISITIISYYLYDIIKKFNNIKNEQNVIKNEQNIIKNKQNLIKNEQNAVDYDLNYLYLPFSESQFMINVKNIVYHSINIFFSDILKTLCITDQIIYKCFQQNSGEQLQLNGIDMYIMNKYINDYDYFNNVWNNNIKPLITNFEKIFYYNLNLNQIKNIVNGFIFNSNSIDFLLTLVNLETNIDNFETYFKNITEMFFILIESMMYIADEYIKNVTNTIIDVIPNFDSYLHNSFEKKFILELEGFIENTNNMVQGNSQYNQELRKQIYDNISSIIQDKKTDLQERQRDLSESSLFENLNYNLNNITTDSKNKVMNIVNTMS